MNIAHPHKGEEEAHPEPSTVEQRGPGERSVPPADLVEACACDLSTGDAKLRAAVDPPLKGDAALVFATPGAPGRRRIAIIREHVVYERLKSLGQHRHNGRRVTDQVQHVDANSPVLRLDLYTIGDKALTAALRVGVLTRDPQALERSRAD